MEASEPETPEENPKNKKNEGEKTGKIEDGGSTGGC